MGYWQKNFAILNGKIMSNRVYIIAEAGVNHNGDVDLALELVEAAKEAGADAIKFQTFKAEQLVSRYAPKAPYQIKQTGRKESQFEMLRNLELGDTSHKKLLTHCKAREIDFLSSPFDLESLDFLLQELKLPRIKLPSGEITNAPLLLRAAWKRKPIILSTGMSTLEEVESALAVLAFGYLRMEQIPSHSHFQNAYSSENGQSFLRESVTLLHCTTEYPAPLDSVNLRAMRTLLSVFGLQVGYSDHTIGIAVPMAAVANGAKIIEKHFTLDRNFDGPDHQSSMEPLEFKYMVDSIRNVEQAMGGAKKIPAPVEIENRKNVRKSLVAACDILKGEVFSEKNITLKRPGEGLSPMSYWDVLGKKASRSFSADEQISL
jgi:N-acetylneuraminate synthase